MDRLLKKVNKNSLFFLLILLLALGLRLYRLDLLELFGDELDVGYHAYSLLTTGRGYMGQKLPLYIHSFSEWRAPLLMYFTAPFVGLLGLNAWGVRMTPVLFGVLSIGLLYYLVKLISKDEKLSLISALLLTLTPWHLHYSRTAFEVTLLLSLVLLGTIGFLKKKWWLSSIAFGLSFYAYNTANVFVPLWLIVLTWTNKKKIKKIDKSMVFSGLLFIFLVLPLGLKIIQGYGSARFNLISIFSNPKTIDQIVFKRTTGLDPKIERVFHNKLTGWGREFIGNYFTAFSPDFLFLNGDLNPRHSLPGFGQLYWWLLGFWLMGIYRLAKAKDKGLKRLVFGWLLISPLASCLTVGGGNQATRLFLMLPPLVILISLGIRKFFSYFGIFIILGSLFISLIFYSHNYLVHYGQEHYRYWHYGYQEAMSWLFQNENNFERIIINNNYEPGLLRYLFWTKKDPAIFQSEFETDEISEGVLPSFSGFRLGEKVYFGSIGQEDKLAWLKNNLTASDVYLAIQQDEAPGDWDWYSDSPEGLKVWQKVDNPWGEPLMYWVSKEK